MNIIEFKSLPSDKFISDTHFGHLNIIKYCNRPFLNTLEMDNFIIEKWNKTISKEDRVFFLGDFALTSRERIKELLSIINGYKILIIGNHDKRISKKFWLENGFKIATKKILYIDKNKYYILTHKKIEHNNEILKYITKKYNTTPINIHGHSHNYKNNDKYHINISVEVINYTPKTLNQIT